MHIRNFIALGSGEAISRVIGFAGYVYLARVLGAEGYGIIAFAAGVTLYLSKFADFAIEAVGTSEIAKDVGAIRTLGAAMLGARLVMAIGLAAVSTLVVQLTVPEPDRTVLSLYFLTLIPVAASTKWIHMGLQDTLPIGILRVVGESVFLVIVVATVRNTGDLWIVPLALLAGESVTNAALYLRLHRSGHGFWPQWDPATALPTMRRAAPLMGQILMGLLLYNMDLLLLRAFRDAESVGYYAAAYMLISFLANMGMVYGMSILPALAKHAKYSGDERRLYHTATAEVFAITLPIAVGGIFVAQGVINVAFGEGYQASVLVLQILVWVIPTAVVRNVPWAALIVRGKSAPLFRATTIAVIANGLLNVVLINLIGLSGAAIATVIAEPLGAALMFYYGSREGLPVVPLRRLWPTLLSAALMAAVLMALGDTRLRVLVPVGIAVYGTSMLALGRIGFRGLVPILKA